MEALTQLLALKQDAAPGFSCALIAALAAKLKELTDENQTKNEEIGTLLALAEEFLAEDKIERQTAGSPRKLVSDFAPAKKIRLTLSAKEAILSNCDELLAFAPESIRTRLFNCLNALKIENIGELLGYKEEELLKVRNFGQACLYATTNFFISKGIDWEMLNPKMKIYFQRMQAIAYEDVPGLVETEEFEKITQMLGEESVSCFRRQNVLKRYEPLWIFLLSSLKDDSIEMLNTVESLIEVIHSKVVSFLAKELSNYLDTQ